MHLALVKSCINERRQLLQSYFLPSRSLVTSKSRDHGANLGLGGRGSLVAITLYNFESSAVPKEIASI